MTVSDYSVAQVIGSEPDDGPAMKEFVERALPAFIAKRSSYGLALGILDAYLDGKADSDFLNMKALKLVITMEMLTHGYLRANSATESETILSRGELSRCQATLRTAVKGILRDSGVSTGRANRIAGKVAELNRRPFEDILGQLLAGVGLTLSNEDRKAFASCRNSLAHDGQFWSSRTPRDDGCPFATGWQGNMQEYFFLESLVDRVILRVLDYDGPYLDWRPNPSEPVENQLPVRRQHVTD